MDLIYLKFNDNLKIYIPSSDSNDNMYGSKNVQDELRNNKIWSKEETSLFIDILSNNKTNNGINDENIVIDVGSNTGYFTLISLFYDYNTIAIEPNQVYKKYIDKSLEINNFNKTKLRYYENFASDSEKEILFDGWSGVESMMAYNNKYYVKTVSIDNICDKNVLLLKIDVEGGEPSVFRSVNNLINNKKIKYIIFELTYIIKNKLIQEQIDMLPYLKFNNYDLFEIVDNKIIHIKNIRDRVNYWIKEYKTNHLVKNPKLIDLYAGTNILAVQKGNRIPNPSLFS